MSGPVIAFVEVLNRDAPLNGPIDQGTSSCVQNLGMEHVSSRPEVVYLESMTRPVIDGHSESQTICSTADEGFDRPSGRRELRLVSVAPFAQHRRGGVAVVDLRTDVATGAE
jgi:hypothetical protein